MVARLSLIKMRQVTFTVLTLNRCLCDFDRIMGIVCILSILFFLCQRNFLQIWAAQLTPWQVSLTHQSHQSKPAFFSGTVSPTEFCRLLGAVVAAPLRPPESHGRGHHGHGGSGSGFDAVATTWQWFITIQGSGNFEFCCIFFGAEFQETKPLRHPTNPAGQFHGTLEPGTGFDPEACGEACEALAEAVAKGNQHQARGILVKWRGEGDDYDLWWWCWW